MIFTVGEMAKEMGIPASTLRYYDQEGLLPFVERSSNGMRVFSDKDYGWLRIIECLKKSGLSLKEIKKFIDMAQLGDESIQGRLDLFKSRRESVLKQMEELQETLDILDYKCWYYQQASIDGTEDHVKQLTYQDVPDEFKEIKYKLDTLHGK